MIITDQKINDTTPYTLSVLIGAGSGSLGLKAVWMVIGPVPMSPNTTPSAPPKLQCRTGRSGLGSSRRLAADNQVGLVEHLSFGDQHSDGIPHVLNNYALPETSGAKPRCPGLEAEYGKGEVVCVGRTVCGMGAGLAPSVSGVVPKALRFWFRSHERVYAPPHLWGVGIHGEVTALGDLGEFDAVLL